MITGGEWRGEGFRLETTFYRVDAEARPIAGLIVCVASSEMLEHRLRLQENEYVPFILFYFLGVTKLRIPYRAIRGAINVNIGRL